MVKHGYIHCNNSNNRFNLISANCLHFRTKKKHKKLQLREISGLMASIFYIHQQRTMSMYELNSSLSTFAVLL